MQLNKKIFLFAIYSHETQKEVEEQKESFADEQKKFDELNAKLEEMNKENEAKTADLSLKKK